MKYMSSSSQFVPFYSLQSTSTTTSQDGNPQATAGGAVPWNFHQGSLQGGAAPQPGSNSRFIDLSTTVASPYSFTYRQDMMRCSYEKQEQEHDACASRCGRFCPHIGKLPFSAQVQHSHFGNSHQDSADHCVNNVSDKIASQQSQHHAQASSLESDICVQEKEQQRERLSHGVSLEYSGETRKGVVLDDSRTCFGRDSPKSAKKSPGGCEEDQVDNHEKSDVIADLTVEIGPTI